MTPDPIREGTVKTVHGVGVMALLDKVADLVPDAPTPRYHNNEYAATLEYPVGGDHDRRVVVTVWHDGSAVRVAGTACASTPSHEATFKGSPADVVAAYVAGVLRLAAR